jgi:hypothetical protein
MSLKSGIGVIAYFVYALTWIGASLDYYVWRQEIDKIGIYLGMGEPMNGIGGHIWWDLDRMTGIDCYNDAFTWFLISIKLLVFAAGFIIPAVIIVGLFGEHDASTTINTLSDQ